jgi:hypothetical protein
VVTGVLTQQEERIDTINIVLCHTRVDTHREMIVLGSVVIAIESEGKPLA